MSHLHGLGLRFGLLVSTVCVGCDPLAPQSYWGESSLSLQASVQLEGQALPSGLRVAVAFLASHKDTLRLVDAQVHGDFPGRFRLDLEQAPPADALITKRDHADAGRIALGVIAALPAGHPSYVDLAAEGPVSTGPLGQCDASGCDCGAAGCERVVETCVREHFMPCYVQTFNCPNANSKNAECTELSHEGDESITRLPWTVLAGASTNYLIAFLEQDAPAGGLYAKALNAETGLRSGYHLLAVEEAPAAPDACDDIAQSLVDSHNESYGTDDTLEELRSGICDGAPCMGQRWASFDEQIEDRIELTGCREPKKKLRAVSSDEPIAVELGKVLLLDSLHL